MQTHFHFVIVIVCLKAPLLFRPLTDNSVFLSKSQPGLNSVQFNPVLFCSDLYFSFRDIYTYLFKDHLCTCESYSYIQSPFEWCSYVASYYSLTFISPWCFSSMSATSSYDRHLLLSSNLFLLLWCSCHMYLFLSLVWLS